MCNKQMDFLTTKIMPSTYHLDPMRKKTKTTGGTAPALAAMQPDIQQQNRGNLYTNR